MHLVMYLESEDGEPLSSEVMIRVEPTLGESSLRDEARNDYIKQAAEWAWTLYLIAHGRKFTPITPTFQRIPIPSIPTQSIPPTQPTHPTPTEEE